MAYVALEKSGCGVHKGNVKLRLDFFLEEGEPRYEERYLHLVDTTSPKYLAGYLGKVDKEGQPEDQQDYDRWYQSLPLVWQNTPFHSHFIYPQPDFTEEDVKQAMEIHLKNLYRAFQERADTIAGGMRHGWDISTRTRPGDHSANQARLQQCQAAIDHLRCFSYRPKRQGGGETYPSTLIDIGADALNRASNLSLNYTYVGLDNPANASGTIDTYELWAETSMTGTNTVGTMTGSGADYASRDHEVIGSVLIGAKRTFTGLTINVQTGDFVGLHYSVGRVEAALSGGSGIYWKAGNQFGLGVKTYAFNPGNVFSQYGTGESPDPPRSAAACAAKLIGHKMI